MAVYNNVELKRPEYHPNRDLIPISGSDDGQFHVSRSTKIQNQIYRANMRTDPKDLASRYLDN